MADNKKLGLGLLIMLGIGSMIGSGIFNSPTDLIGKANPQATLIAWGIGGFGALCLALVFQRLANKRPELKGGIYSYARAGFGDFIGYNSAWGYWTAGLLGNVAFFVLLFKTINSLLGEGNELAPIVSFVLASALLWVLTWFISKGIKDAGVLNAVVTVAKLVPLVLVILLGFFAFDPAIFNVANWKTTLASTGDPTTVFEQVKRAMGTILWCFYGVEAAVVLSEKAESQKAVGKATVISLLITLGIYVSVSTLAMGIINAKGLAEASTPLATVLGATMFGSAGSLIVKLGLITSILGATLSWILLVAEIPYVAGKDGIMPRWFAKENKNGVPINSLVLTNALTQVFLLALLSEQLQSAYYTIYYISTTTVLIPYMFSTLFAVKVSFEDKQYGFNLIVAILGTIYALYIIYAVGLLYLALTLIMFAIGVIPYYFAKREREEKYNLMEIVVSLIIVLGAAYLIWQIYLGNIQP